MTTPPVLELDQPPVATPAIGGAVAKPRKLSEVEHTKTASRALRGTIADVIADPVAPTFDEEDATLLKTHGTYQQYDRDTATERKQHGLPKQYYMMVRTRIPGGRLGPDQYLQLDEIAGRLANGSLRVTTRQTFQFHGVPKGDLKALMQGISAALLTTLAACGDVVRNVTCTPAPIKDAVHDELNAAARLLSTRLLPQSNAYCEIWLDGEKVAEPGAVEEPLYGATYLPRKFKIGLAAPDDNSIDVLTNDVGIVARVEGGRIVAYTLTVGGGLGMTHNKPKTYPRLATPLLDVEPEGLLEAVEAVVKVQRDHGDRTDRKHARLKYLVDDMGTPWFKAQVEAMAGRAYAEPMPLPKFQIADHLGWHEQGDGRWYLGIPIPSGRIDDASVPLRSTLRAIVARWRPNVVLSPSQDILLTDIPARSKRWIEAALRKAGIPLAQDLKPFERWALACPALPTCGLALTEAERVRQPLVEAIMARLSAHRLEDERISFRITGCPNGCARPYAGDIGLVGRMPGYYAVYIGGDFEGTRLNARLLDRVAEADIATVLDPLFAAFAAERQGTEGFGDYCHRQGLERLGALIAASGTRAA